MPTITEIIYADGKKLATLTETLEGESVAFQNTLAYRTYSAGYLFGYCTAEFTGNVRPYQDITLPQNDDTLHFYTIKKRYIDLFQWTDNDDAKIKKGQPVSNLTAEKWNALVSLATEFRTISMTQQWRPMPQATAGGTITWRIAWPVQFNLSAALGALDATSGNELAQHRIAAGAPIKAEIFAGSGMNLKTAINKIILAMRP